MDVRRAEGPNRRGVRRRDVPDVRHEPIARVERVEPSHHPIPDDLRDDRSRSDRGAPRVAVDDRPMGRRCRTKPEPVDETRVSRRGQIRENGAQRGEIRPMEARPVDLESGHDADADLRSAPQDCFEQRLALFLRDLLRVIESRERTHPRTAQRFVVEKNAGDDERTGKRAASRLVRPRDVANAEASVVCEEPLAAGTSHAAEDSA